ncbi:peroxiredoxin [Deinococcus sp.]|uniref:peroxiredoxin n=1 Tax=Deinococcus sp. TaxID=47478 RepID=UPI0025EAA7D7|nr:peroxiredoxin [Deinococcus sp.]
MTLQVGQLAPAFEVRSDDGHTVSLEALRGLWVVLYFYPRAMTPGCNIEAQRFEQALPEFQRRGARVIGVSTDTEARAAQFRDSCSLSFPLLPDSEREVSKLYGVLGGVTGLLGIANRHSFLIDPAGNVAYIWRKVNPGRHAGDVLRELESLQAQPV